MEILFEYDKDNISAKKVKQLTKYVDNPDYTPENVQRQSKAAMSLCMSSVQPSIVRSGVLRLWDTVSTNRSISSFLRRSSSRVACRSDR